MLKAHLLKNNKSTYKDKAREVLMFCNKELKSILVGELALILEYLKPKSSISFLGKMNSSTIDTLKNIKNISWDVFHIRNLELSMLALKPRIGNVVVPALYSVDKKFNQIREYFEVKMIVLDKQDFNYYCFYEKAYIVNETIKDLNIESEFNSKNYAARRKITLMII